MPDVDSRLDRRLQSFFDEIKAQPLPQQVADFKPATVRSVRKGLNFLAGTVAVAVIAATATVFAIELNGHRGAGSLAPAATAVATSTPKPTPSSSAASSLPGGAKVLIPPTSGTGTETLPTVTLGPNEGIWIAYSCSSSAMPFNSIFVSGAGVPAFLGPNFQFWLHEFSTPNRCSGTLPTGAGQGGATDRAVQRRQSIGHVDGRCLRVPIARDRRLQLSTDEHAELSRIHAAVPRCAGAARRKGADQDHLWLGVGNTSDCHRRTTCAARH